MKNPRARRLGALIAACAVVSISIAACDGNPFVPLPEEGPPEQLFFTFGGFGIPSRQVEVRKDTVVFRRASFGGPVIEVDSVRAVPTAAEWREFWAAAEESGVSRWRRRYRAEGIVDGAGWGLKIRAGGRTLESEGSNAYPDRAGREHEGDTTPEFRAFVGALGDLAGVEIL